MNLKFINEYIFALLVRFFLFLILLIFPVYHSQYNFLSPLTYYGNIADIELYKSFFVWINFNLYEFIDYYLYSFNLINKDEYIADFVYPKILVGPFFPLILKVTIYSETNTLFMSLLCILAEYISICIWIKYFKINKIPRFLIYLFCILPIPLIFSYAHTSDIFFYLFSTVFFYLILINRNFLSNKALFVLFILFLIRPTSFIYILFTFFLIIFRKLLITRNQTFILLIIFIINILYYLPYVNYEIYKNYIFFEESNPALFIIFSDNYIINSLLFYLYKFISTIGFQISNSQNLIIIIPKLFSATIFLFGFLFMNYKNFRDNEAIFINFYLLFVIIFLSPQYRYIIPIAPLLFNYFCLNVKDSLFYNLKLPK